MIERYNNKITKSIEWFNRVIFITLSLLFSLYYSSTYARVLNIEKLEIIPRNDINDTYEDRKGFIWIATRDGLYRYDGHNCREFLPSQKEGSISSSMILSIDEDTRGNIWLCTYGRGLSMYNPHNGTFRNYSLQDIYGSTNNYHDIVTIEIDRQNNIWIGSARGVGRIVLDPKSYDIVSYYDYTDQLELNEEDPNIQITKIFEDKSGNIWIGNTNHVLQVVEIHEDKLSTHRHDISCLDICDYTSNAILVGGRGVTPITMNTESGEYLIGDKLTPNHSDIVYYSSGSIWSGNRIGLRKFNNLDDKWVQDNEIKNNNIFESNIITAIMSSNSDQLWVSTRGGGLYIIDERSKPFINYPTIERNGSITKSIRKAIYEDSHGNIWIGSESRGVDFVSSNADYMKGSINLTVNNVDNRVSSFSESGADGTGRNLMWMGTSAPIFLAAVDIDNLETIAHNPYTPKFGFILSLIHSDNSTLWAGSYRNGLWRLNIDERGNIVSWKHFMANRDDAKYGLSSNTIRHLYIDRNGDLWITTEMGVNRIENSDLLSDEPKFIKSLGYNDHVLSGYYIMQVLQSKNGDFYFGTMGGGIARYTPTTDQLYFIDKISGLANDTVKSIVEDEENEMIWIATNEGLSSYNPENGYITNYSNVHGISDIEFSEICGVKRSNGMIAFGNRQGIVEFDPQKIPISKVTPTLLFTDLVVNNRRVEVGAKDGILSRSMEYTNSIELDYDERNFTISFVGINLSSPLGNKYRYRLHGFDREWKICSDVNSSASYTNIQAGNYTFSVQVSNSNDVWSERILELQITIHPPFYLSGIAFILYVLLCISIGFLIFWITRQRYLKRRDLDIARVEQQRIEEMMQYKLDFFMNVSHEFRTPLTLITLPLERSIEEARTMGNKVLEESMDLIGRNVTVLKKLINEVLDLRKVEDGKQPIKVNPCELNNFVSTYYELFTLTAERRSIEFVLTQSNENIVADLDKRLFEKVIMNLLSNSFRHTPDGGRIEIGIKNDKLKGVVIIELTDNGCGVDKESLQRIFDQFYQADNATSGGSGIGLSLCKGIVELHNGAITVESEIGNGFRAVIELPQSRNRASSNEQHSIIDEDVVNSYSMESGLNQPTAEPQTEPSIKINNEVKCSTILIVEDNTDLRHELMATLGAEFQMLEAENGEQGVDMCRKHYPDLVITDIMMPVMDGIEMCRIIKSDEDISHTPIMVLTANSTIKSQIDSFTIGGAEGYLDKPFDISVLRSNVRAILYNRSLLQDRFQRQSIVTPDAVAHTPTDVKFLSQIISIIKEDIGNSELNVELIAQRYGVSRTYLNRKIKALTGDTSIIFLRRIRLKYAASLLTQGELNVNEIAWEVGYNDINTFRLRFKEMYGVSPTNYKGEDQN